MTSPLLRLEDLGRSTAVDLLSPPPHMPATADDIEWARELFAHTGAGAGTVRPATPASARPAATPPPTTIAPLVPSAPPAVAAAKPAANTPEGWKVEWEASVDLRAEFPTADHYVKYMQGVKAGRIRRVLGTVVASQDPAQQARRSLLAAPASGQG